MDAVVYNKALAIKSDTSTILSDALTLLNRGTVKNIQRGTCTATSINTVGVYSNNLPINITISPVSSTSKASVRLPNVIVDYEASGTTVRLALAATLTSTSNLQISGSVYLNGGTTSWTIGWEVVEYY